MLEPFLWELKEEDYKKILNLYCPKIDGFMLEYEDEIFEWCISVNCDRMSEKNMYCVKHQLEAIKN